MSNKRLDANSVGLTSLGLWRGTISVILVGALTSCIQGLFPVSPEEAARDLRAEVDEILAGNGGNQVAGLPGAVSEEETARGISGPDSDKDGIRDDVERLVYARGIKGRARTALLAFSVASVESMVAAAGGRDAEAVQASIREAEAFGCFLAFSAIPGGEPGGEVHGRREFAEVSSLLYDSRARREAAARADDLPGQTAPGRIRLKTCESSFPGDDGP